MCKWESISDTEEAEHWVKQSEDGRHLLIKNFEKTEHGFKVTYSIAYLDSKSLVGFTGKGEE